MKKAMKLFTLALVAGGTMFAATRVSIGVGIGGYAAPPAYVAVRPPCPGPGYTWVNGVWRAPARIAVRRDFDRGRHVDRYDHGRDVRDRGHEFHR